MTIISIISHYKFKNICNENTRMNISFINDEFSDNIEECVYFCRQNSIKFIEIRRIDGKDICDFSDEELKQISNILEQNDIAVSCVSSRVLKKESFPFLSGEDETKTNFAFNRAIQTAKILKATRIRIFSGQQSSKFSFEEFASFLCNKQEILKRSGVDILIENEKSCNIASVADLRHFFENFSLPHIFPLIDFGNAVKVGETDSFLQYIFLKDRCRYYHIKDMDINNRYCAVGSGVFDLKSIKENAVETSVFSLEPGTKNKEDMETSMRYMKERFLNV